MMASEESRATPILNTSLQSTHASSLAAAGQRSPVQSPPQKRQPGAQTEPASRSQQRSGKQANPRHLAVALHHAHRIQAQKDAEALILQRILDLIALPSSPSADPAAPSGSDAAAVKSALVPFQPADFDNLILERNIEGLCGYALCPREHRKEDSNAQFRIMWGPKGSGENGRGRDMTVVPREKLEMWCSAECAERAMYLRIQLEERPVWERRAENATSKQLTLLEEARASKQARTRENKGKGKERVAGSVDSTSFTADGTESVDDTVTEKLKKLAVDGSPFSNSSRLQELAVERGDSSVPFQQGGRLEVQILEKEPETTPGTAPAAPILLPESRTGGSIEGYVPENHRDQSSTTTTTTRVARQAEEDDQQDMLDVI